MAIEGSLRELSIEDVLQLLSLAGKTGVLTLHSDRLNDDAVIHFSNGDVVFAVRRRSRRRTGRLLVRMGKLTQRELNAALEMQRTEPQRRLGEVLLGMGAIAEDELERPLRLQQEETMHELMMWRDGHFQFEERADIARQGGLLLAARVESLLMESARRHDEWTRFAAVVPAPESVPVLARPDSVAARPLKLDLSQWALLAEVDGERDIGQLAADMGRSVFDVAQMVSGLANDGVVDVGNARSRAAAETSSHPVGLDPVSADTHYQLGVTALRTGDFERAAKAWDTYVRMSANGGQRDKVVTLLSAVRTITQFLHGATSLE